jgi:hypothetical protein
LTSHRKAERVAIAKGLKRLSVDVAIADAEALTAGYVEDGIPVSQRGRLLVHLWARDPELRARVVELAKAVRRGDVEI